MLVMVVADETVKPNTSHCVTAVVHVEIADAPPEATCAEEMAIGADALILLAEVGMTGALGGAEDATFQTSMEIDPDTSPVIAHPTIVPA
jgi:hypothetical protein